MARKYGKTGVLSITPAFQTLTDPEPTVLHRSDQAVFGNMQVTDSEQAEQVIQSVDGIVDTVALDNTFGEAVGTQGTESNVVQFDDRLAIARAITYFLDEHIDTQSPSVTELGTHPVVEPLIGILANRGWPVTLHAEEIGFDLREDVTYTKTTKSAVTNINALIVLNNAEAPSVGEEILSNLPEDCTLLDAGIQNLSRAAIERASNRGLDVFDQRNVPGISRKLSAH